MIMRAMRGKWAAYGCHWFCFIFTILVYRIQGYCTLNSEGLALFQFRAKVEVDPFGALANWNPSDCDPCMWSGIECLEGKVVMLNQSGRNLKGELVPELGILSHLRILDLSKNSFSGTIPPQFGQLVTLEVLDLRDNKLSGKVPAEIGKLSHLRCLFLRNNKLEGSIPVDIGKQSLLSDLQFDDILSTAAGIHCINRKFGNFIWQCVLKQSKKSDSFKLPLKWSLTHHLNMLFPKFKHGSDSSQECIDHSSSDQTGVIRNMHEEANNVRRVLIEQPANLPALPPNNETRVPPPLDTIVLIPNQSSGSFPAVPNMIIPSAPAPSPAPSPESGLPDKGGPGAADQPSASPGAVNHPDDDASNGEKSVVSVKLITGISIAVLLLIVAAVILYIYQCRARTIVPWKTGLSGQLQKAFVTGVPKLNRSELETACEDFSNIVYTREGVATLYKGTLSTGVEIAVASTAVASINKWSKLAEMTYRKEIDSLSRVNHKNFVNLIGYCQEDDPFTRMLVFEYAPNGTLCEHLHVPELEHLDWNARMRIIMGIAYCLQHMHSLDPPVAHISLTSREIFLTDDYAAKIADVSFWGKLISSSMKQAENELEHSDLPSSADDVAANVYNFGVLMLEILSGRLPHSQEQGDIVKWADSYLNDKNNFKELVDPTLESFDESQLEAVCEAIRSCTEQNPKARPPMLEVIPTLKQALSISPEAAHPRLSPLWWAELEISSSETS